MKIVADNLPVDGLKVSFVEETLAAETDPEVTSSKITYLVAFVDVSSEIVSPPLEVTQLTPVPTDCKTCPEVPVEFNTS